MRPLKNGILYLSLSEQSVDPAHRGHSLSRRSFSVVGKSDIKCRFEVCAYLQMSLHHSYNTATK